MIEKKKNTRKIFCGAFLSECRICSHCLPLWGNVDWESTGSRWRVGGHVEMLYDQWQCQQQHWQHKYSTIIKRVRLMYVAVGGVRHVSAACCSAVVFEAAMGWTCCWREKCKGAKPVSAPIFLCVLPLHSPVFLLYFPQCFSPAFAFLNERQKNNKTLGFSFVFELQKGGVKGDRGLRETGK